MKLIKLLPLLPVILITSCIGPEVSNRDSNGRFKLPECPKCGLPAIHVQNVFTDVNGHKFHTK